MNILVLGSGGREHALAWVLSKSPLCDTLYVAPGNGGTARFACNVEDLAITNGEEVCQFAHNHAVGLVVVGPEAPLVAGVADVLRKQGIPCFGPDKQGARLEGSKSFSKQFMVRNSIPTAEYISCDQPEQAHEYIDSHSAPIVVKADGLAAGKGVVVAATQQEAHRAVDACFEGSFGTAGKRVVIEECLNGFECSVLAFVCNGKAFCMELAQDHKRALDGDKGANTGGMGAYSPVSHVSADQLNEMYNIMQQAASACAREFENDYRGVLYGGFMLTATGAKMLEFNVRFGDPETQVILPRLENDAVELFLAVAQGRSDDIHLRWSDNCCVGVVLASGGYPAAYKKGFTITGIDEAERDSSVQVFHAGTTCDGLGSLVTTGGRVLCVSACGVSFEAARQKAYDACNCIHFKDMFYRHDIGYQEMQHPRA